MNRIQITVLKTMVFDDLQKYCSNKIGKCPAFSEGQVFETTYDKPEKFCDWAWRDIHPYLAAFISGGNFSEGDFFKGWMKDKDTMIACCTDGIRPAVFEIKRVKVS